MARLKIQMPKFGKSAPGSPEKPGGKSNRLLMGGATLCCALGIGYVMQFGLALPGQSAGKVVSVEDITMTSSEGAMPKQPDALGALSGVNVALAAAEFSEPPRALAPVGARSEVQGFGCDISMQVTPTAGAMVDMALVAPCNAGERVTVHHSGMMFTEVMQPDGTLNLTVPALTETALYMASFANGDGASASAEINTLSFYDRAVVQWRGQAGLQLHAREYTDSYFGQGHVWAAEAGDLGRVARGEGGFLIRLGREDTPDALMAEVYSFPTGTARRSGDILLTVEAEVTASNCNSIVEAQTLELGEDNALQVHDLTLDMPGCDTVGDFLVLKNLVQDLNIAAR